MKFPILRVSPEHRQEFRNVSSLRNLSIFFPFTIVLAFVQATLLVFQSFRFGSDIFKLSYFYIYIATFTIAVFFALIFSYYRKIPDKTRSTLIDILFIVFIIAICLAIGAIELYYGTTTNTMFIAILFFLVCLVSFNTYTLWVIITVSITCHTILCFLSTEIDMNEKVGLALNNLLLFCMFIPSAAVIHNNRVTSFYQQKEINDTNITLKRANIKLEQLNLQLEISSKTDSLTNVLNRNAFNAALELGWQRAISLQEDITAMMIDVDFFKNYNDLYGHIEGDNCLRQVSSAIRKSLHRNGDCVYRFGGEEFVVLLFGADGIGADNIQQRIMKAVADLKIKSSEKDNDYVTVSIGIHTEVPTLNETPERFIERADTALYYAKKHGRNRVIYYKDISDNNFSLKK